MGVNFSAIVDGSAKIPSSLGTVVKPVFVGGTGAKSTSGVASTKTPQQDKAMWEGMCPFNNDLALTSISTTSTFFLQLTTMQVPQLWSSFSSSSWLQYSSGFDSGEREYNYPTIQWRKRLYHWLEGKLEAKMRRSCGNGKAKVDYMNQSLKTNLLDHRFSMLGIVRTKKSIKRLLMENRSSAVVS